MIILYIILGVLALLLAVLLINTIYAPKKGRKLSERIQNCSESQQLEYAKRLSKMIQCETVSNKDSFDDTEFKKLRETVKELFPTFCNKAELKIFSDDCWIYKIDGKDNSRNIMVMSHHDVVAGTGEWEHPAFGGEISDGKIWGRGTVDTKTPLFAELTALEELLNEGFAPPYNIYLGSSHNEEIGGDGIPEALKYFKENNIVFDFILDEGGAVIDAPMAGINCRCAMLAVHEKGRYTLKCTANESEGHVGLSPKTETPVVRMAKFIAETDKKKPFIKRISPEVKAMFQGLCPYMSFPLRLVMSNLWLFAPLLKAIMPKLNPMAGAMIGTMCSFNAISGGNHGSIQKKEVTAYAFLRCINEKDLEKDLEELKKIAEKYDITLTEEPNNEYHPPADITKPQYDYIKNCVSKVFPHVAVAPFILPAGTDARWLTEVCPCIIRFAPIDLSKQQFASVHSPNENIDVRTVGDAVVFYKKLIKEYK